MTAAPREAVLRTPAFSGLPEVEEDWEDEVPEVLPLVLPLPVLSPLLLLEEPPLELPLLLPLPALGLGVAEGATMRDPLLAAAPPVLMTAVLSPMTEGWETGRPAPAVIIGVGLGVPLGWLVVALPPAAEPESEPEPEPPLKTLPASCWASAMFLGGIWNPADLQPPLSWEKRPEASTVFGQYWTMLVRTSVRKLPSAAPLHMHLMSVGPQPASRMLFWTQGSRAAWPATWLEKARATTAAERAEKRAILMIGG